MAFYSEYPLKNISRFVNKLWCLDNSKDQKDVQNLKILPNGCFNIALLIGEGAWVALKNKTYHFKQGIYLCSQITTSLNLTLLGYSKVILIQLHPWYFSYYSKNDLSNFVDDISESDSCYTLLGQVIDLNSADILQETLQITEKHFLDFIHKYPDKNIIEKIISDIQSQKGDCKISDILENYTFSQRWIQVNFKKALGLSPKQFANIIQFRDAVDKIAYDTSIESLTSIAYEAGFSDQSHFIKNFRQFSGTAPSKFNPSSFVLSFKK